MHPDEAALRRAVCASPDDDLPRLVFADYLEERGDARRAQFIRLQCEQARELWGTPRWAELGRLAAAVAPDRDGWRDTLGGLADGGEFVRGFVGRAAVTPGVFVSRGADLFDREPVQSVRVTGPADPGDDWARVVASPHVARVRELDLGRVDMTHLDLDRLARAGTLAHLTGLTLGRGRFDWGTGHVVDLLAALPNLTRLSRPGGGWGGEHLRALLTRPPADRLTTLEVTGGAGAIAALAAGRHTAGVRRLWLNADAAPCFEALSGSGVLAGLEVLELACHLGAGADRLAAGGRTAFAHTLKVVAVSFKAWPAAQDALRAAFPAAHVHVR